MDYLIQIEKSDHTIETLTDNVKIKYVNKHNKTKNFLDKVKSYSVKVDKITIPPRDERNAR